MKKCISLLCTLLLCATTLFGCNSTEKPATIATDTFLSESTSAIPENAFSFSNSEYKDVKFDSYLHEHGTSSVNSSILIYRYDDTLVFAVSYLQGPISAMETFVLNQEQGDSFLEMVGNYKKAKKENDNSNIIGGDYTKYKLNYSSKDIIIEPLPLSQLALTLKSDAELAFVDSYPFEVPSGDDNGTFPSMLTVGHSYPALYSCIAEQANQLFGSRIASVEEIEVGPADGLMHVTLEDGTSHKLLVTNAGFIVNYI